MGRSLFVLLFLVSALSIGCFKLANTEDVDTSSSSVVDEGEGEGEGEGSDCECNSGDCCDGCHYRASSFQCSSVAQSYEHQCSSTQCGADRQIRAVTQHCSGTSAICDGATTNGSWNTVASCGATQLCSSTGSATTCTDCQYGCIGDQCVVPECTTGACCDIETGTGTLMPSTHVCETTVEYRCSGTECGADAQSQTAQTKCSGSSANCNGTTTTGSWTTVENCGMEAACKFGDSGAWCTPCSHGCSLGTCNDSLAWAKQAGGNDDNDRGNDISTLSDGSALVTGYLTGTAVFGEGETNETSLTSAGYSDIFIAKYNSDGSLAWAKQAGNSSNNIGSGISTLSDGSALVTGYLTGTAVFGEGETNETSLTSAGYDDIFIAKYNSDGTLDWAKQAGSSSDDVSSGISTLSDGSALVTGYFEGTAVFGEGGTKQTSLISTGNYDIFIAKYNSDGTLDWAKQAGGNDYDAGNGISTLSDGSALVTGYFYRTAVFGEGETNQTSLTSAGYSGIFIAKYNSDGTLDWAKQAGGSGHDKGNGISTLSDGSALVTGYFYRTAVFGEGETNETSLTSTGTYDIFLAKYNSDGTLDWAKQVGGDDYDAGNGISTLSDGSALVAGYFGGTAVFGEGETNQTSLTSAGYDDIFIAKYKP